MSYINEQLLTSSIYIPIHKLTKTKNIDGLIKNELKKIMKIYAMKMVLLLKMV